MMMGRTLSGSRPPENACATRLSGSSSARRERSSTFPTARPTTSAAPATRRWSRTASPSSLSRNSGVGPGWQRLNATSRRPADARRSTHTGSTARPSWHGSRTPRNRRRGAVSAPRPARYSRSSRAHAHFDAGPVAVTTRDLCRQHYQRGDREGTSPGAAAPIGSTGRPRVGTPSG